MAPFEKFENHRPRTSVQPSVAGTSYDQRSIAALLACGENLQDED
jgi:hypothetical protein